MFIASAFISGAFSGSGIGRRSASVGKVMTVCVDACSERSPSSLDFRGLLAAISWLITWLLRKLVR